MPLYGDITGAKFSHVIQILICLAFHRIQANFNNNSKVLDTPLAFVYIMKKPSMAIIYTCCVR